MLPRRKGATRWFQRHAPASLRRPSRMGAPSRASARRTRCAPREDLERRPLRRERPSPMFGPELAANRFPGFPRIVRAGRKAFVEEAFLPVRQGWRGGSATVGIVEARPQSLRKLETVALRKAEGLARDFGLGHAGSLAETDKVPITPKRWVEGGEARHDRKLGGQLQQRSPRSSRRVSLSGAPEALIGSKGGRGWRGFASQLTVLKATSSRSRSSRGSALRSKGRSSATGRPRSVTIHRVPSS